MSIGMNVLSGRWLFDHDHLRQSIKKILTTLVGTRIERREFGSLIPELVDSPVNSKLIMLIYASVATALMQHEPRLKLQRIQTEFNNNLNEPKLVILLEGVVMINAWQEYVELTIGLD